VFKLLHWPKQKIGLTYDYVGMVTAPLRTKNTLTKKRIKLPYTHIFYQHNKFLANNPKLFECYKVIFCKNHKVYNLDFYESKWVSNLAADINIAKTILPKFK